MLALWVIIALARCGSLRLALRRASAGLAQCTRTTVPWRSAPCLAASTGRFACGFTPSRCRAVHFVVPDRPPTRCATRAVSGALIRCTVPSLTRTSLAVIPQQILTLIKNREVFAYSRLVPKAPGSKAFRTDELVLTADFTFVPKAFNRNDDRALEFEDWDIVADAVLEQCRILCSPAHALAQERHNKNVRYLNKRHGWPRAREYDIGTREAFSVNSLHDAGSLNSVLWVSIYTRPEFAYSEPSPPVKRSVDAESSGAQLRSKRSRIQASPSAGPSKTHCFRCGRSGHLPRECTSTTTLAGKPVANLASGPNSRSPNALADADGRAFCFSFAKLSLCSHAAACRYVSQT